MQNNQVKNEDKKLEEKDMEEAIILQKEDKFAEGVELRVVEVRMINVEEKMETSIVNHESSEEEFVGEESSEEEFIFKK